MQIKKGNYFLWMIYTALISMMMWISVSHNVKVFMNLFGISFYFSLKTIHDAYLILFLIIGLLLAYTSHPHWFKMFVKDMRLLRVAHYELMLLLGVTLAVTGPAYEIVHHLYALERLVMKVILCTIGLVFLCLAAIVFNNLSDFEIDKICNQNRPLIKSSVNPLLYKKFGYGFMLVGLFYAAMVSVSAFLILGMFIGVYQLYSTYPLRLKRVTFFSKLAISINSLALIILGYCLAQNGIEGFPNSLYGIYLLGVTLAANFIDLKDVRGDKIVGIMTLPILLGEKKAKIIIGGGFWLTYLAFFAIIKDSYFVPVLFLAGGLQFYLINRAVYSEFPVLVFYNLSLVILIFYLFFTRSHF